jgi:hypothetical protein
MQLTAKKSFPYAKRQLRVGDTFEAPPSDARILVLVGRASYAEEPRRRYKRRDIQAQA